MANDVAAIDAAFVRSVWSYYDGHGRHTMPWRLTHDPYSVLVSEIMLQQTSVNRVIPKYAAFMSAFPTLKALAAADLASVIRLWHGLGYNRRARFLHMAAQSIVRDDHSGSMPSDHAALMRLPGIGPNTAAAIMNYAFNVPTPFIETNIRTVYIHHYFADHLSVDDKAIVAVVARTMDDQHPREWFWALMDYGASLKSAGSRHLEKAVGYKKQSPFDGSVRQMRGAIITALSQSTRYVNDDDLRRMTRADHRYDMALAGLMRDQMIIGDGLTGYKLAG